MADITAKRGPINPNDYLNSQGIATKSMLQNINQESQFKREQKSKEKSGWEKAGDYISTAGKIFGSIADMYNTYQNTWGDDSEQELAVESQKAAQSQQKVNNTKTASQLSDVNISSKIEADKEAESLNFKQKIEGAIDANNEEDVVRYSLEDIRSAKENKDLLEQIASYYEWNGHQQSADLIRGAYSGNPQKVNISSSDSSPNISNPEQYNKYLSYKDNVSVLSNQLMSPTNSGKLANLGLDTEDSEKLASDLLTTCDLEITDTNDYNLDKNKFTSTINGTDNLSSVINSTAENSYQTPANNIQFLKISKKTPIGVRTETFTIDPSIITTVPYRDDNGIYTRDQETDYGTVVSKVVAQGLQYKEKAKKKYNVPELAPAITTDSVNKEQLKRDSSMVKEDITITDTPTTRKRNTKKELINNENLKKTTSDNLKIDSDKFNEGVIQDARKFLNDESKRHNLLRVLSIPDKWYDKVSPAQKAHFLRECIIAVHTRRNKEEIDEFKQDLKDKFSL